MELDQTKHQISARFTLSFPEYKKRRARAHVQMCSVHDLCQRLAKGTHIVKVTLWVMTFMKSRDFMPITWQNSTF